MELVKELIKYNALEVHASPTEWEDKISFTGKLTYGTNNPVLMRGTY